MAYTKEYLKAKAEEVWNAYECFKDDVYCLAEKARVAGIENTEKLDLSDTFIDLNETLGLALEELFGIKCFDEE